MSHFYASIEGQAGPATRCGSKKSGIVAWAASWSGRVALYLVHDPETGKDHFRVCQLIHTNGAGVHETLAEGVVGKAAP